MFLSGFTTYFLPAIILAVIGGLFGVVIAVCAKAFYVKIDDRVEKVTAMLPGYNCGACGNAGCAGMADKIVSGECDPKLCKPLKADKIEEIINLLKQESE